MPKTNTCNPEVQAYFCEVGRYWVREFDIDGWRLDVASEINDGFWRAFRQAVKEEKSECILIGEVWETAQHWLNGDIFDSTMNYDFRKHCRRFFAEQSIDAAEFDARVTNMRMRYKLPVLYAQLNLLDSHDVSRFYSLCEKDPARMQLAVLFQMTFTGIPSVFYGDERGIYGLQEAEYRHEMTWSQEPPALADFYKKAMHLRTEHPALCRGSYHTVKAEKENGLYGYERTDEKDHCVPQQSICRCGHSFDERKDAVAAGIRGKKQQSCPYGVCRIHTGGVKRERDDSGSGRSCRCVQGNRQQGAA